MPTEGLTLTDIESQVARNLLGSDFVSSSASAAGTTTTLVDNTLTGAKDSHKGNWLLFTSGDNVGKERRVTASAIASDVTTLTFSPALGTATASGDTYKMFDNIYSSLMIREAVKQATNAIIGRFYRREESLARHGDGVTSRFDLPSEFDMVDRIEYRASVISKEIQTCDALWDTIDADVTASVDSEDKKLGSSLKLVVGAGAAVNDVLAKDDFTTTDYSGMTHVELWIKSTVALSAADLHLLLDNTAGGGSAVETLAIPAVTANVWTYVRVALATPELDTAILHVEIRMSVDKGPFTLWLDDIKAVNHDSSIWVRLLKHLWRIDQEEKDLILTPSGRGAAGYRLLKISGGSNPAQMTASSTVATVPEEYLIAKATALLLMGGSRSGDQDMDGRRTLAGFWEGQAGRAKGKMPVLVDARAVT